MPNEKIDGAYLASTAMLTKHYIARPFAWDDDADLVGSVYTPDGGVLRAKTYAEAQRFADELNRLLDCQDAATSVLPIKETYHKNVRVYYADTAELPFIPTIGWYFDDEVGCPIGPYKTLQTTINKLEKYFEQFETQ